MTTPRDQIDPAADNVIDTLPCSVTQARFWFLEKIEPGNAALNVALRWELRGIFRAESIEQAFRTIIARHEILRTRFIERNGEPMQQVLADIPFKMSVIDLTRLPSSTRMDEAQEISAREAQAPFLLSETPLIRATLLQLDDNHAHLLITVHHIAFDGWSIRVLGREIGEIASAIDSGREPILPDLPLQYADFGLWQREFVKSQKFSDDKEYWLERLSDAPYFEVLPDRPRTPRQTFNGDLISEPVPLEVSEKLTALAKSEGVSLFSVGVATIATAMQRFTGENEIVIGTQIANRDDADLEDLIGVFINNIVLRLDTQGDPSFAELLKRSAGIVQDGLMHGQVPFDDLVRALRRTPDLSRAPLYSVNFIFQRAFMENARYGAFELAGIPSESPGALLDLDVVLVQRPDGWRATIQFNTDLYDRRTAERILELWQLTMRAAAFSPREHISRLDVVSDVNKAHLSRRAPRPNYPHDKSAHALFTEIAAAQPNAIALIEGERTMTYGELERRSNQMARLLQKLGARRGRRVAVVAPRSIETIVSFLSIIKTGAAYLPIDGDYPPERLAYMLDDCAPALVITHKDAREKITSFAGPIVDLDSANMEMAESNAAIESDSGADDPIYIMYTSGSTGKPKGAVIPHRGIVRMARAQQGHLDYGPRHTLLHVCALAFDASAQEIWCALLTGARMAIIRSHPASLAQIEETIARTNVTLVTLPTALFHVLAEHRPEALRGVRQIVIGGDVLSAAAALHVYQACPDIEIINGYGPTENTIDSTNYLVPRAISANATVPIGRAIGATDCYILDSYGNLAPPGAVGELYVGGDGVALGYHNRPDITAEKFPPDRFATLPGARLYRTGDLVRLRPDGLIEYIGRADMQVKIRGMRVEPGEVEAALIAHESVGEAIVVARDTSAAGKQLFAYVSPAADRTQPLEVLPRVLHEHLSRVLPPHMVPAGICVLRTLPQTANGKVDRRALPNISALSAAALAPSADEDAPTAEHVTEAQSRLREREIEEIDAIDTDRAPNLPKLGLSRPPPLPNYPRDKTAHALFAEIASAQPDATALIDGARTMTYDELDRRSNQMARRLQNLGAHRGRRVAVVAPRSIETIISILGVIKAGSAYIPLDRDYPMDRLSDMLEDCAPAIVIVHKDARDKIGAFNGPIVDLDIAAMDMAESDALVESDSAALDPIYLMYTSGSTGKPKGAIIPHRGIVRYARAQQDFLTLGPQHTMMHVCALAFDASAQEIWCALLNGSPIAIIKSHPPTLAQIADTIATHNCTIGILPTALFHLLAEHRPEALRGMKQLVVGGDVLSAAAVLRVYQAVPDIEIVNGYGPTECTIVSTLYKVPRDITPTTVLPIGRLIGATDGYAIDRHGNLAPPDALGELYIGGDGVGLGYHNKPELSAEKFVDDTISNAPGGRLYRTGDIVRMRPDGLIEYFGRTDMQVKIRGMRVEPGEVEAALAAHESVGEAIVIARDVPPQGKMLFAYVSPAVDRIEPLETLPRILHEHLSRILPPYMVPSGIGVLCALPQTPNGKVDRGALPNIPKLSAISHERTLPSSGEGLSDSEQLTETQSKLRDIWREILKQDQIGLNDSFFDLGGHSLLAFRMYARVEEIFGRKLEILALFQSPTLRQFSALLNEALAPRAAEPVEDWQIIRLQANGAKPPIIAIDNPILYYQLARNLGEDQPFTCLQLYNPDRPQTLAPQTFPEIAAQYVRLLKAAHPTGPYHLMGLCIAGALAVEVARQLQAGGDDANVVITYDTWRPGFSKTLTLPHRLVLNLSDRFDAHIRRWEHFRRGEMTVSEWAASFKFMNALIALALKLKLIKSAPERTAAWSPPWFQQHLLKARRTIDSFSGDLMVFKSEETPRGPLFDPHMGWRAPDKGRVMIYDVKGGHLSMLAAPNVGDVAEKIKAVLDAAPAP